MDEPELVDGEWVFRREDGTLIRAPQPSALVEYLDSIAEDQRQDYEALISHKRAFSEAKKRRLIAGQKSVPGDKRSV